MINFLKYKYLYSLISLIAIGIGLYHLAVFGLKLSVDFTGGTIGEYELTQDITSDQIEKAFADGQLSNLNYQITGKKVTIKSSDFRQNQSEDFMRILKNLDDGVLELRFESLGPIMGKEMIAKTIAGLLISAALILLYIAYAFKDIKFGIAATLATLHDSIILIGTFSVLGAWAGVEIDALFVTALLTILSFSVHDTIVVFDRIREHQRKNKTKSLVEISNMALNETMVRSINNSLTIIFMLAALLILGGESIRWFTAALLVGTISGTYSSPFVATPLLVLSHRLFVRK
jgi:preprotein translocase subunit SecF